MKIRLLLNLGAAGALTFAMALPATAQKFPERPVRLIVPFAPGGQNDLVGRLWAQKVTPILGQVIVENRGGAGGSIGSTEVARANPDGHTLLLGNTTTVVINPVAMTKPTYDPLKDLTPIAIITTVPTVIVVHPSMPAKTLKQLIGFAKAHPGKLSYGSAGAGSITHFTGVLPHLQAKRVKVLGVTTAKRSPQVPDYMSAQEAGIPGVDASIWVGLFAPKGTPKDILSKLYKAAADVLTLPDVKERYASVGGAETTTMGTAEFTKRVRADLERYRKVAAQVGIQQQ